MKRDSLINIIRARFADAVASVAGGAAGRADALVRPAQDARHGDYQCNAAMSLAKSLKAKPREIAERIVAAVDLADLCEKPEIAGPGFINVRLSDEFLARYLGEIPPPSEPGAQATGHAQAADRLGMPPVAEPQTVVIDYASPNIAKQMHVGHLRSTIIGDVFARVLAFEGHAVIRQNHVGDWGTQFGILIEHYREQAVPSRQTHDDVLAAIEDDYRAAQERFKSDEGFAEAARLAVGRLQAGDGAARGVWERICAESRRAFGNAFGRLNVLLTDDDVRGESFYNDRLAPVVAELREKLPGGAKHGQAGLERATPRAEVRENQGALCVFMYDADGEPRFRNPDGDELPMIIQKSDGAFLYATTDLAAMRYRIKELSGRRIIYVTDARQKLHFEMLFAAARAVGWACDDVALEHTPFGSILGSNRRPLRTREGKNVLLRELLDESERRALALLEQREKSDEGGGALADSEKRRIAQRVGIAAVKYADLARDRKSDYVFNWDNMLAMQGNTAPYMMYAYARIRSIYRKAAERFGEPNVYAENVGISLAEPAERALALRLSRLRETIDTVAAELAPHTLCTYLYDVATDFSRFYEACPVLRAADEATRLGRMRLCDLTARTLKLGLGLLGIEVLERM
jgi:arginyl-tRNA synthetase